MSDQYNHNFLLFLVNIPPLFAQVSDHWSCGHCWMLFSNSVDYVCIIQIYQVQKAKVSVATVACNGEWSGDLKSSAAILMSHDKDHVIMTSRHRESPNKCWE